ncbi:MAG TPA: acylneuraminate cytidylyltransferase family protein [Candidatus Binatia bacterium]|nr:acylneuraminate cytidylyltransferase family protein [Candidatus Binatia bacterium]
MALSCLGVIPARGGSKGIPRKNIRIVAGRPLIAYTIEVAQRSSRLTRTVVSTEDEEIAEVARLLGAEVPFRRPRELATNEAPSVSVACHALDFVEKEEGRRYDCLALLEPTSPLRKAEDVDGAIALLEESGADSVVSLCRLEAPHPAKLKILQDGRIKPFLPELWREGLQRQELSPVYFLNGGIYAVKRDFLIESQTFWGEKTLPYLMPEDRSVNIDTWFDLKLVECLITTSEKNESPKRSN